MVQMGQKWSKWDKNGTKWDKNGVLLAALLSVNLNPQPVGLRGLGNTLKYQQIAC